MTPRVELIYDVDCPNMNAARTALLRAFAHAQVVASWVEYDRRAVESPAHVRGYGSPTILVNGQDVAGARSGELLECCRLYRDGENGLRGAPSSEQIVTALTEARFPVSSANGEASTRFGWRGFMAVMPGVGASVLPIGACPACWPAYAGFLSSVGLGFLFEKTYLFPLVAVLLGVALGSLAYRAKARFGDMPLGLGVCGVSLALVGKFTLSSDPVLYLGLVLLAGASLWNAWPQRTANSTSCTACALQELAVSQPSARKEVIP